MTPHVPSSTPAVAPPCRRSVVLLGLSAQERDALAQCLRGVPRGGVVLHPVDSLALADLVVADADRSDIVREVIAAGRLADTVFVGRSPPPAAQASVGRPLAAQEVEARLCALAAERARPEPCGAVDLLLEDLGPPAPPAAAEAGPGGGRSAVVLDASGVARKFLAERLGALGYVPRLAATVDEARALLQSGGHSVAFTDVDVGPAGADAGLALCREIKQWPAAPAVVVVSGKAGAGDRVRGSLAGCDGYVAKPVSAQELRETLRRVDPLFDRAARADRRSARGKGR